MNRILGLLALAISLNLMAADSACVTCNQKNVSGMPNLNGINQIEKVVAKTNEVPSAPIGKFYDYCTNFESASNFKTIEPLMDKIVKDGYSAEENLSRCDCPPNAINSIKNKIPMVQLLAEDIYGRYNFPKDIFEYYKRKDKIDSWVRIINAKNTKGMTLLDYVKYNYEKSKDSYDSDTVKKFKDIYSYICERNGELAYYKDTNCKSGL